jgi:prophage regulatory protein
MNEEDDELLRLDEVAKRVTFSPRKIWRDVAAGMFPKPVRLGSRTTRWWKSEVLKFLRGEWPSGHAH